MHIFGEECFISTSEDFWRIDSLLLTMLDILRICSPGVLITFNRSNKEEFDWNKLWQIFIMNLTWIFCKKNPEFLPVNSSWIGWNWVQSDLCSYVRWKHFSQDSTIRHFLFSHHKQESSLRHWWYRTAEIIGT